MNILQQIELNYLEILDNLDITELGIDEFIIRSEEEFRKFQIQFLVARIEELDEIIANSPSYRANWQIERKQERSVVTSLGELNYTRRYYKNKITGEYCYLIDKLIGLESKSRVSKELATKLCNLAVDTSYSNSSKATQSLVSKQTVMNTTRKVNVRQAELNEQGTEVHELHLQVDEDHVAMQDGSNEQLRLAVAHESYEKNGNKSILTNKRVIINHREGLEEYWDRIYDTLCLNYNMSEDCKIFIHGDGAFWIKHGTSLIDNTVFVLDKFHAMKYLKKIVNEDSDEYTQLRTYMYENKKKSFKDLASNLIGNVEGKNPNKQEEGLKYILNQWPGISSWSKYPEHSSSCAEGLVSHILSSRFSSRPMGWSEDGVISIGSLREQKENGGKVEIRDFGRKETDETYIQIIESVKLGEIRENTHKEISGAPEFSQALSIRQVGPLKDMFDSIKYGGSSFRAS